MQIRVHSGACHVGSVQLYVIDQRGFEALFNDDPDEDLSKILLREGRSKGTKQGYESLTPRCNRLILARQQRPLERQMSSGAQQLLCPAFGLQGVSLG